MIPGYTWQRTGDYTVTTTVIIPWLLYVSRLELRDDAVPHGGVFYDISITPFFSFAIHWGEPKEKDDAS